MSADPQLTAWRLARAGKWDRFEHVLRKSCAARRFIQMLPYQMYFDGYQRAEHIARVLDAEVVTRCVSDKSEVPRTAAADIRNSAASNTGHKSQDLGAVKDHTNPGSSEPTHTKPSRQGNTG